MSENDSDLLRAVILTAIPVEFKAVCSHLMNMREEVHPQGNIYNCGSFIFKSQHWDVSVVETGAGNVNAAFEAERAINFLKPSVVFFVGVAGGLKDVKIGDVVAASKVYYHEPGKASVTFLTRPEIGNPTFRIMQRARAEARKSDWLQWLKKPISTSAPGVYVAPIAAGEKVVASTRSSTWKFLREQYSDALAVEMEGYGFLLAAHASQQVNALVIRGISDLIDGKSASDAANSQEIAAQHASAFAFEILAKLGEDAAFLSLLGIWRRSTREVAEGRDCLKLGKSALLDGDDVGYISAKQHIDKAADLLHEVQQREESGQIKFLQALILLSGHRPFSTTESTFHLVEQFLSAANKLDTSYAYTYTLALVKHDFSQFYPSLKREAQELKRQANLMVQTPQDQENLKLLQRCQPRLINASRQWW